MNNFADDDDVHMVISTTMACIIKPQEIRLKNIFVKMENWQQSFFINMFNESALSKQNIERWYPLAENKVEETHENQAKQISF